jgi:hypothetical protein
VGTHDCVTALTDPIYLAIPEGQAAREALRLQLNEYARDLTARLGSCSSLRRKGVASLARGRAGVVRRRPC